MRVTLLRPTNQWLLVCSERGVHPELILEHFHHPQEKPSAHQPPLPMSCLLQAQGATHLLPLPIDWPILDTLDQWGNIICDLLCLPSLI